jgi:VWFA-related protein
VNLWQNWFLALNVNKLDFPTTLQEPYVLQESDVITLISVKTFATKPIWYMIIAKHFVFQEFEMKNLFLAVLIITFSAFALLAQTPTPKTNDDDVVVINTSLIQIDVTVTDSKGKIITDLKAEDFEIFENKDKQDITNFSFIQTQTEAKPLPSPTPNSADTKLMIPLPPARIKLENVRRTVAVVVDDLNLSFESTAFVRRALKKFVDEQMQDGDLVAIIRTGGGIGALQQFTSDKRQLYAAIEKVRWNPQGSGGIGAFAPIESSAADQRKNSDSSQSDEDYKEAKGREREQANFRASLFATGTLGALNYVIKGMKDLPGRKSVMLLSDGFSLTEINRNGFKEGNSTIFTALRGLVDLANRSSVVVYTMDARGLQTLGVSASDNTSDLTQEQVDQQVSDRKDALFETQSTLREIAKETGGIAIVNNNDLSGGIQRMLDDQKGYYLIGYQPDGETFDAKTRRFNKLIVKVKRPNLKVRYRSGFFGTSDADTEKTNAAAKLTTPQQQIINAITSPFAKNDISLSLNALYANDVKLGAYIRPLLHINAKDLKFSDEPDGKHKLTFEVIAMTFGDNGILVDQLSKGYTLTLSGETYKQILEKGFVYNFVVPIKKPGAYQMRVALRDSGSEKVGSASQFIEIPDIKKHRLLVSSLVLENQTVEDFNKETGGQIQPDKVVADPLTDTALRRFRQGTVIRYGFEVYNAVLDKQTQKPNLQVQLRVFRNGKLILEGKTTEIPLVNQTDLSQIKGLGAMTLGNRMEAGEYILQVVVTDTLAKEKYKISTQFVQFEIIE